MFKNTMTPTARSCANLAGGTDPNTTYEIALVLDNSGSMSESAGGVTKIQSLRTAATSFTNTMFSKVTTGKLKMSITPFNAAVIAVDPTIAANRTLSWIDTGGNSSQHWTVFGDPGSGPFANLAARNAAAKAAAAAERLHQPFRHLCEVEGREIVMGLERMFRASALSDGRQRYAAGSKRPHEI